MQDIELVRSIEVEFVCLLPERFWICFGHVFSAVSNCVEPPFHYSPGTQIGNFKGRDCMVEIGHKDTGSRHNTSKFINLKTFNWLP